MRKKFLIGLVFFLLIAVGIGIYYYFNMRVPRQGVATTFQAAMDIASRTEIYEDKSYVQYTYNWNIVYITKRGKVKEWKDLIAVTAKNGSNDGVVLRDRDGKRISGGINDMMSVVELIDYLEKEY